MQLYLQKLLFKVVYISRLRNTLVMKSMDFIKAEFTGTRDKNVQQPQNRMDYYFGAYLCNSGIIFFKMGLI